MNKSDYLSFEEDTTDFPFYKDTNLLQNNTGLGLLISVILFAFLIFGPVRFYDRHEEIILFLAMMIPLAVFLKENFYLFFRKPKQSDIKLLVMCFVCSLFLQTFFAMIVMNLGFSMDANTVNTMDLWIVITQFIQIIAEELFKAIIFLIALHLIYKHTGNRKLSVIIAIAVSLFMFGLFHANSYSLAYAVMAIGFGGFFEFLPYVKTRNLLLTIILHFMINMFIMGIHAI